MSGQARERRDRRLFEVVAVVEGVALAAVITCLALLAGTVSRHGQRVAAEQRVTVCDTRYLHALAVVLRERAVISDDSAAAVNTWQNAVAVDPPRSAALVTAHADYATEEGTLAGLRRRYPIPPPPGC
jgi:hypothetical protein